MKKFIIRFLLLLLCITTIQVIGFGQEKGRVLNIQAEQRTDGSDIIDVYYDLLGYQGSYNIQAQLILSLSNQEEVLEEYCTGDFGPGIAPGTNKHFAFHVGGQRPDSEIQKVHIEVRAYFTMGGPCSGQATVSYLGKTYNTIQIGGQCWLKENLDAGTRIDYEVLPWLDDQIEKYCYDNLTSNCDTYGALYHWWEAMFYGQGLPGDQGICPAGFHIPTNQEFTILVNLFGGFAWAGGALKSLNFWESPNTGATNLSHFSALGSGTGYNTAGLGGPDACFQLEEVSYMWTSSMTAGPNKPAFALYHNNGQSGLINLTAEPFPFGSVRCMKDCAQQPTASNAGPDQIVSNSNFTTLAANTPDHGLGKWIIKSNHSAGKDGEVADQWDPASLFYGYPGEIYTLEWQISNECTMTVNECLITFSTLNCGEDFTDNRNGMVYPTVQVGDYCWMAKNMNIGEQTPVGEYNQSGGIEKSCYDDDGANCDQYGGLYTWSEAVQQEYTGDYRRGICPLGWFVPTDNAWCNLTFSIDATVDCETTFDYTGTDAGGQLKEDGTAHWQSPNTGAVNTSGFTALGSGWATNNWSNKGFHEMNQTTRFWTSSKYGTSNRYYWYLGSNESRVGREYGSWYYDEYSIRCVHYPNY